MIKTFEFPEDATPINDCSDLIPSWVLDRTDLNRVEAENILQAQKKYLRNPVDHPKNWFRVSELKTIHQTMFCAVKAGLNKMCAHSRFFRGESSAQR